MLKKKSLVNTCTKREMDAPDHLEEGNPKPLDEDDIALLKTYVRNLKL